MGILAKFLENADDRNVQLARDLLALAMADGKLTDEERSVIKQLCQCEGISEEELVSTLHGHEWTEERAVPTTMKGKNDYLIRMIKVMGADGYCSPEEIYLLEIVAAKMGLRRFHVQALMLMHATHRDFPQFGQKVYDSFVRNIIDPKGHSNEENHQRIAMMYDAVAESTDIMGDPAEDEAMLRQVMQRAGEAFLQNRILCKEFGDIGVNFSQLLQQERELAIRRWLGA